MKTAGKYENLRRLLLASVIPASAVAALNVLGQGSGGSGSVSASDLCNPSETLYNADQGPGLTVFWSGSKTAVSECGSQGTSSFSPANIFNCPCGCGQNADDCYCAPPSPPWELQIPGGVAGIRG